MKEEKQKQVPGSKFGDYVNYVFLIIMFSLYLILTDNAYFNITITRYRCYMYAACGFILLSVVARIIRIATQGDDIFTSVAKDQKIYLRPGFWCILFLIANMVSFLMCEVKQDAFQGATGRYMGLLIYLVMGIAFFFLKDGLSVKYQLFYVFAFASALAMLVALAQHIQSTSFPFGTWGTALKDGLGKDQYTKFISTFGNINIFAGFLCMAVPIFLAMFTFVENVYAKAVSGLLLVFSGFSVFIANSDSSYFGIAVAGFFLLLLAIREKKLFWLSAGVTLYSVGNLWVELINTYHPKVRYDKARGGIGLTLDRMDVALAFFFAMLIITIAIRYINRLFDERLEKVDRKKVIIYILVAFGILLLAAIIYIFGVRHFKMYDKWGSYRGYIWPKIWGLFKEAPLKNKVFGYGQETVRMLTESNFYEEMVLVTNRTYDNAHNELLQYLITTGLFGVITYVGLVVSTVVYVIKNMKQNPVAYMCVAAVLGYFAQSLISLNQPITTPLYFTFLGMGIGVVSDKRRKKENETV